MSQEKKMKVCRFFKFSLLRCHLSLWYPLGPSCVTHCQSLSRNENRENRMKIKGKKLQNCAETDALLVIW